MAANLALVASILNIIVTTVKEVEARSEEAKAAGEKVFTGEFKRELAVSIIREAFLLKNPGSEVKFDAALDAIKSTIATIVSAFNLLKIFKKGN